MKPQVISFHYDLTDKAGKAIESSRKGGVPLVCLEGAGQILPGLEAALSALKKGEKKTVKLASVDAYGEHDAKLIVQVPKSQLPPVEGGELKKGSQFQSETPEGHLQIFTVTEVKENQVTLDGNHPLAGQDLTFDVEVVEIRDATEEELQHGHAHGGDGHHHH